MTLANLGVGTMNVGDLGHAQCPIEEALRLVRSHSDRAKEGGVLTNLTQTALWQGDPVRAKTLAREALDILLLAQDGEKGVEAWLAIGEAELAMGRHAESRQTFDQALARARRTGSPRQFNVDAGLARLALVQGDTAAAMTALQPLLALTAACTASDRTAFDRQVDLCCHQVLAAAGDPRAAAWLACAHARLQAQPATIADAALRQGFLTDLPHHPDIVAAWAARP